MSTHNSHFRGLGKYFSTCVMNTISFKRGPLWSRAIDLTSPPLLMESMAIASLSKHSSQSLHVFWAIFDICLPKWNLCKAFTPRCYHQCPVNNSHWSCLTSRSYINQLVLIKMGKNQNQGKKNQRHRISVAERVVRSWLVPACVLKSCRSHLSLFRINSCVPVAGNRSFTQIN